MAEKWRVTAQRQTSELTPAGSFIDVMEVHFDVIGVSSGTVKLPLSQYTEEAVRDAIEEQASKMIAVHNL